MKVTFYGGIALAAIAAETAKAAYLQEDSTELDFAQSDVGPMSLKAETCSEVCTRADSDVAAEEDLAQVEVDTWTDLDSEALSEAESEADLELDSEIESVSNFGSEDGDLALAQVDS